MALSKAFQPFAVIQDLKRTIARQFTDDGHGGGYLWLTREPRA